MCMFVSTKKPQKQKTKNKNRNHDSIGICFKFKKLCILTRCISIIPANLLTYTHPTNILL